MGKVEVAYWEVALTIVAVTAVVWGLSFAEADYSKIMDETANPPIVHCYNGVEYLEFKTGPALSYNADGTIAACE